MTDSTPPAPKKSASLLESTVLKLFTRSGCVLATEEVGAAFRIFTIGGEGLRGANWTPGDKVQMQMGGWVQRTYTPIEWDAEAGRMRILVYLHAAGPGTDWARTLRKDTACTIFGPRKSVDLTRLNTSALLFGDETSFGLAAALVGTVRPTSTQCLFEVSSLTAVQPALARVGLESTQLVVREVNDAHLGALEEQLQLMLQAQPNANIVLSGKASSIQRMSKLLKHLKVASSRIQVRAYWATGKTGLD